MQDFVLIKFYNFLDSGNCNLLTINCFHALEFHTMENSFNGTSLTFCRVFIALNRSHFTTRAAIINSLEFR